MAFDTRIERVYRRPRWAGGMLALLAVLFTALLPGRVSGQMDEFLDRCTPTTQLLLGLTAPECQEVALLAQSVQAGVGLAQAGPGTFVGSASTLGRRFGSTPRVALSGRVGLTRFPLPDFSQATIGSRKVNAPSLHGAVVVGLFDGFSPAPTVGGFLSVDLLASGDVVLLSGDDGFDGSSAAWGYGIRLGLVRESFTLPGVTLSATRRHGGSVAADGGSGGVPAVDLDVLTTSVRGAVGKDLVGLGFTAGIGWDRYESDGTLTHRPLPGETQPRTLGVNGFDSDRILFYGGVSRTFLVMQVAGEVGWARGFDEPRAELPGYDPDTGSVFGTLSLRLTF